MAKEHLSEPLLFVVGASAGGIDALERLVSSLPADFAAPIVIAQHLDPMRESRLEPILQTCTSLAVVSVDASTPLKPGTIYVVPAGRHVEITDNTVGTVQRGSKTRAHPQPSIDLLFITGARTHGDRTVGVVLSGTGSDGAAGAAAIKEAGGTIVIQDPATAAFPGLPASIAPIHVDLVAEIDSMASLLASIAATSQGDGGVVIDQEMLRGFLTQIRVRSGIDFTQYKTPTIVRRLTRLMAASQCRTLPDYMRYLNAHPDAYQRLIGSFLIKVTGFFRDPSLYKYLQEQILPDIVSRVRKSHSELRLWSAGCATGEEAYSMAILVSEILGDDLDEIDVRIFATDLDSESIAFARRGIYPASAFADMPPELLSKYFNKHDDSYQVKKRIRNLTVFGEYDLGQRAPFPRIDLILCRNVLIYFTRELQHRTLQLFAFSLREGGYLVLGKSETTSSLPQYFATIHPTLKVFRRQGERLLIPAPTFVEGALPTDAPPVRRNVQRMVSTLPRRPIENPQRTSLTERLGSFLFESPVGVVLVDRNYDIQAINQAARRLLGVHGQGIGEDLVHLIQGVDSQELKAALDNAFRSESFGRYEMQYTDEALNEIRYLQISCFPERASGKEPRIGGVIALIEDSTEPSKHRRDLETQFHAARAQLERLARQSDELLQRQRSLTEANTELTAANSELRSTNEHLLIAAEEAEASAEEVETLNEEMQATSEELQTLNEELQATVEELNTTNEELSARGDELERLAKDRQEQLAASETARALYAFAIERAPLAVAVLDGTGRVLRVSAMYDDLTGSGYRLPKIGEPWKKVPQDGFSFHEIDLEQGRLVVVLANAHSPG